MLSTAQCFYLYKGFEISGFSIDFSDYYYQVIFIGTKIAFEGIVYDEFDTNLEFEFIEFSRKTLKVESIKLKF